MAREDGLFERKDRFAARLRNAEAFNLKSARLFERMDVGPSERKRDEGQKQTLDVLKVGQLSGNNWPREPQKPRKHLLGLTGAEEDKTQERQSGQRRLKNQAASAPRRCCPGKHSNEPTSS